MCMKQPTKMKCSYCDYEWTTLSDKKFVTCPNCLNKTRREERKEEGDQEENEPSYKNHKSEHLNKIDT